MSRRLDAATYSVEDTRPRPARARIVHLGVGAFHRAHQAWFTTHSDPAAEWGIHAFSGRSPLAADVLRTQDGLYTMTTRGPLGDDIEVIGSVIAVDSGDDITALVSALSAPDTAIVTLTITEAGYRLGLDGHPNPHDEIIARDLAALHVRAGGSLPPLGSMLGRVLAGLAERRRGDGGPLAIVPCDNMPSNGRTMRTGLLVLANAYDPALATWIEQNVSFVDTCVDRITPRTTDADRIEVTRRTGWVDDAAVVTEPFADWVLSGDFPGGRPAWERAGARFVSDIRPWEQRKLWLLNGAHTILASLGSLRGHDTVAQAIDDAYCRAAVEAFWDEAQLHLPAHLDIPAYRASLLNRFANSRIEHLLAQIADDALLKTRARLVPVALAERQADRSATATTLGIAGVLLHSGIRPDLSYARARIAELDTDISADTELVDSIYAGMRSLLTIPTASRREAPHDHR